MPLRRERYAANLMGKSTFARLYRKKEVHIIENQDQE